MNEILRGFFANLHGGYSITLGHRAVRVRLVLGIGFTRNLPRGRLFLLLSNRHSHRRMKVVIRTSFGGGESFLVEESYSCIIRYLAQEAVK